MPHKNKMRCHSLLRSRKRQRVVLNAYARLKYYSAELSTATAITCINALRDHALRDRARHDPRDIRLPAFCCRSNSLCRGRRHVRDCDCHGPNASRVPSHASSFSYHHAQSGCIEGACRGIRGVRSSPHAARIWAPLLARDHCSHSTYTSLHDTGDTNVPHKRRCPRTRPADNRRMFRVLPPFQEGKI